MLQLKKAFFCNFTFTTGIFAICEPCNWRYKEILLVPNQSQWHPVEFWEVPNHCRWHALQKVKTIDLKIETQSALNLVKHMCNYHSGSNVFPLLQVWTSLPHWESGKGRSRTSLIDFLSICHRWQSDDPPVNAPVHLSWIWSEEEQASGLQCIDSENKFPFATGRVFM